MTQEHFATFFDSVAHNAAGEPFAEAGLVVAFESTEPESRVLLDGRTRAQDGAWFIVHAGEIAEPKPDVTFVATATTFDRILRGEMSVIPALAMRKVQAHGSVAKAMRLIPALERCLPLYVTAP